MHAETVAVCRRDQQATAAAGGAKTYGEEEERKNWNYNKLNRN